MEQFSYGSYIAITLVYGMMFIIYKKASEDILIKNFFFALSVFLFVISISLDIQRSGMLIWYGFIDIYNLVK